MPQPDAPDARRRDGQGLLAQCIGHTHLPPRGLINRHLYNGLLQLDRHPILQDRLLAGELLQRRLTARVIELFEPREAVSALAHELTGFGDIAELLRQFQHADLHLDDLLFRRHRPPSFREDEDSTGLSD
jgi:hypothetical protein